MIEGKGEQSDGLRGINVYYLGDKDDAVRHGNAINYDLVGVVVLIDDFILRI